MNNINAAGEFTLEGGHLPVSADRIEARLHEIWQANMAGKPESASAVRLSLANVLVIADGHSRPEAEQLAYEISRIHPSRIFLIILDDDMGSYCAFVATTCSRDPLTNAIRCWEIIEILAPLDHARDIPSAVRSLMVGSVPVISIDYRAVQSTPDFDRVVERISDYSFVAAQFIPATLTDQRTMSLRWHRTLPVRDLLAELFGTVGTDRKPRVPQRITVCGSDEFDICDDLLLGWLMHRLQMPRPAARLHPPFEVRFNGMPVTIQHDRQPSLAQPVILIQFVGGDTATISARISSNTDVLYRLDGAGISTERALSSYPLSRYIVQTFRSSSEFAEYEYSCRQVATLDLSAR